MRPPDWVLSLPEDGSTAGFRKAVLHIKFDDKESPTKEGYFRKSHTLFKALQR
jgi:hypothetical protein